MAKQTALCLQICKSCLKSLELKPKRFRRRLREDLKKMEPDVDCEVDLKSCLKLCPRAAVAFSIQVKQPDGTRRSLRTQERAPEGPGIVQACRDLIHPKGPA